MVMTSRDPKIAGPSSRAASTIRSNRGREAPSCSSFLCAFSTRTTAESTMSPTAMIIPASDMMLTVRPM
jgi:hypothetical protein